MCTNRLSTCFIRVRALRFDIIAVEICVDIWWRQCIDNIDVYKSRKVILEHRIIRWWKRKSERGHTSGPVGNVPSANGTILNGIDRPSPALKLSFCLGIITTKTSSGTWNSTHDAKNAFQRATRGNGRCKPGGCLLFRYCGFDCARKPGGRCASSNVNIQLTHGYHTISSMFCSFSNIRLLGATWDGHFWAANVKGK